ncbi:MAG: hypothetical protein ABSA78_06035 [Candidatus Sulfotelmatobacter sp.]
MELLLNLAWVLLALPAYWLWRRDTEARLARRITPLQCMLALGCVLILLFPVISASDDLHAMRAEMEESATSKRTVRQASGEKNSAWINRLQGAPAAVASAVWLVAPKVELLEVVVVRSFVSSRPSVVHAGRAPPLSLLG